MSVSWSAGALHEPEQIQADPDQLDWRSDVLHPGGRLPRVVDGPVALRSVPPQKPTGKNLPLPEIAHIISESEPTPLSSFDKVFRGNLDTIVAKALDKDKERRCQSAAALADDVERYLSDRPIRARSAGTLYHLGKFSKRNKALVGGILGVLLALLLGTIGTTWWAIAANRAEQKAQSLLADSYEQAAQLASQRGAWSKALDFIDKALETERYRDSVPLRLKRVRALMALNRTEEAGREVEALGQRGSRQV